MSPVLVLIVITLDLCMVTAIDRMYMTYDPITKCIGISMGIALFVANIAAAYSIRKEIAESNRKM